MFLSHSSPLQYSLITAYRYITRTLHSFSCGQELEYSTTRIKDRCQNAFDRHATPASRRMFSESRTHRIYFNKAASFAFCEVMNTSILMEVVQNVNFLETRLKESRLKIRSNGDVVLSRMPLIDTLPQPQG
jgi:hypothetical protein